MIKSFLYSINFSKLTKKIMSLEILDYTPVAVEDKKNINYPKLGTLKVKVGPQIIVCLEVIQGKNGGFFFRVPSMRVGQTWQESYQFVEKPDFGKYVKEILGDVFKNRYLSMYA